MRFRCLILTLIALSTVAAGRPVSADTIYAIGNGGGSLVRFDSAAPSMTTSVSFSGDDSFLDGIDFRPATGQLYGYRSGDHSFYTVDTNSGVLTAALSPSTQVTNTFFLGIDFNPTIDRLRIVTDSAQNLVYNPNTGGVTTATDLFYGSGDVNAGLVPLVIDNAYDNNIAGKFATSQQYVLDYGLDVLAKLNNNTGILTTVGTITLNGSPLDFNQYTGFDILTELDGTNLAYAILTVGGSQSLYTLDLGTGAATSLGGLDPQYGLIYGLTVTPRAVPEPGSIVLIGMGIAVVGVVAHRRRKRTE